MLRPTLQAFLGHQIRCDIFADGRLESDIRQLVDCDNPEAADFRLVLRQGRPPPSAIAASPHEQLGWYRLDIEAGEIEYTLSGQLERSLGTALRACTLVTTWRRGGLLLHGAGLLHSRGGALLAIAPSGGGKSTLVDLADGFTSLSDETVVITPGEPPSLSGTAFRSNSRRANELRSAPLIGLLILEKSAHGAYERAPAHTAARAVFEQAYRLGPSVTGVKPLLQRCSRVAAQVPAFRFRFPKSPAAASLLQGLVDELEG